MVVLLGAGKPAISPLSVKPLVSSEPTHFEYELQERTEETSARLDKMQFVRMRGAGTPPPPSAPPPRPPDPVEETDDWSRNLRKNTADFLADMEAFRAEMRNEFRQLKVIFNTNLHLLECFSPTMHEPQTQSSLVTTPPIHTQSTLGTLPLTHSPTSQSLLTAAQPIHEPQSPIVHSHLWKARCKQVSLNSTAPTGGVKKRRYWKRKKLLIRNKCLLKSSMVPSLLLLDNTVLGQSNISAPSCFLSGNGITVPNFNCVDNGCDAIDFVFGDKLTGIDVTCGNEKRKSADVKVRMQNGDGNEFCKLEGDSVKEDEHGPNLYVKGRDFCALHLLDEMSKPKGLCSVGRTVAGTTIRDKGGGLVHQPLECVIGSLNQDAHGPSLCMKRSREVCAPHLFDDAPHSDDLYYAEKTIACDMSIQDKGGGSVTHGSNGLINSVVASNNDKDGRTEELNVGLFSSAESDGGLSLSYSDESQKIGGHILTNSDEEWGGKDSFDYTAESARLKAATCIAASDGNTLTLHIEPTLFNSHAVVNVGVSTGKDKRKMFDEVSNYNMNTTLGTRYVAAVFNGMGARLKQYCEELNEGGHYLLLVCFLGFDKKIRDKGSGDPLIMDGHVVIGNEFEKIIKLLLVCMSNFITAIGNSEKMALEVIASNWVFESYIISIDHEAKVRGGMDTLLRVITDGTYVLLLTEDICSNGWMELVVLKHVQSGLRTAVCIMMDKSTDVVGAAAQFHYVYIIPSLSCRYGNVISSSWRYRGLNNTVAGWLLLNLSVFLQWFLQIETLNETTPATFVCVLVVIWRRVQGYYIMLGTAAMNLCLIYVFAAMEDRLKQGGIPDIIGGLLLQLSSSQANMRERTVSCAVLVSLSFSDDLLAGGSMAIIQYITDKACVRFYGEIQLEVMVHALEKVRKINGIDILGCKLPWEDKNFDSKEATKPMSEYEEIFTVCCTIPLMVLKVKHYCERFLKKLCYLDIPHTIIRHIITQANGVLIWLFKAHQLFKTTLFKCRAEGEFLVATLLLDQMERQMNLMVVHASSLEKDGSGCMRNGELGVSCRSLSLSDDQFQAFVCSSLDKGKGLGLSITSPQRATMLWTLILKAFGQPHFSNGEDDIAPGYGSKDDYKFHGTDQRAVLGEKVGMINSEDKLASKFLSELQSSVTETLICWYDYFQSIIFHGNAYAALLKFSSITYDSSSKQLNHYLKTHREWVGLMVWKGCHVYHIDLSITAFKTCLFLAFTTWHGTIVVVFAMSLIIEVEEKLQCAALIQNVKLEDKFLLKGGEM